jgi:HD superfamily phosphohydrolase
MTRETVAENYRFKVICDPVHGDIGLSELECQLMDTRSFQRLRHLRQLGLASLVYPNATHTRFAHSLGVFRIMGQVIDFLVKKEKFDEEDQRKMRIAALLHDVGHYPYSHLMEFVDRDPHRPSYLSKPKTAKAPRVTPRRAPYPDHVRIGQLVVTKRDDIASALKRSQIKPEEIASIFRGEHTNKAYNQLISSSLDMDRMDYMIRDSLGTGVPYGKIDLHYLLSNLDLTDEGEVVVSYKAAAAAEHFLVARYFMYKTVYMHKTTFAFEALLRHVLFLLREEGLLYQDGAKIEDMVLSDAFLDFHDGFVDHLIEKYADDKTSRAVCPLCKALKDRIPPKLVHEVAVLSHQSQGAPTEHALFVKDRAKRIKALEDKFKIDASRWIWEDPKDVKFESLGPFVPLSQVSDFKPEEKSSLILVRMRDGKARPLVEDKNSIVHHLSQLKLRMSRLYVVGPVTDKLFASIRNEVQAWCKADE